MKKTTYLFTGLLIMISVSASAQGWKDLKKKAKDSADKVKTSASKDGFSNDEAAGGMKEALNQGVKKGVAQLNKKDGYFKDPQIKIPMPKEVKNVEAKLRKLGQGDKVDEAIESMNRAAEDAAEGAKDIFVVAIKSMTVKDAVNIIKGDKDAATKYLSKATRTELVNKFQPMIKVSLDKVGATKHWKSVFGSYNKLPMVKKVNPDLEEYVTNKALDGLFIQVAKEELNIRENPAARATDLMKKVFGK